MNVRPILGLALAFSVTVGSPAVWSAGDEDLASVYAMATAAGQSTVANPDTLSAPVLVYVDIQGKVLAREAVRLAADDGTHDYFVSLVVADGSYVRTVTCHPRAAQACLEAVLGARYRLSSSVARALDPAVSDAWATSIERLPSDFSHARLPD